MGKNQKISSASTCFTARAPTLIIVALISIWCTVKIPSVDGGFTRRCTHDGRSDSECVFETGDGLHAGFHFLACMNTSCVCHGTMMRDAPKWQLTWNPQNGTCLTAEYGPCGTDRALDIGCQSGFRCIENRCRDPKKVNQTTEGLPCYGQSDCFPGLVCNVTTENGPLVETTCTRNGAGKLGGLDMDLFSKTFKFRSAIFVQCAAFLLYNFS